MSDRRGIGITGTIVDAAAKVRDLNCKSMAEGRGATVTACFGPDGITLCDPNRAGEGPAGVFQKIYAGRFEAGEPGLARRCIRDIDPP